MITTDTPRPPAATLVGVLSLIGLFGTLVMMVAHLGLDIDALQAIGASRLIAPAAISFAVGTVLYAIVAYGAFRLARWAWFAGLLVNALALVMAAFPIRSWVSVVAIVVSLATIAVLLSPQGRAAFRG